MKQAKITYEALGDTLLIHMTKRSWITITAGNVKRNTDLMLDENYINRIIFDLEKQNLWTLPGLGSY